MEEALDNFQSSEYLEMLSLPEGRLHFAGEHTETPHAWIDTAIHTGVRDDDMCHSHVLIKTKTTCMNTVEFTGFTQTMSSIRNSFSAV